MKQTFALMLACIKKALFNQQDQLLNTKLTTEQAQKLYALSTAHDLSHLVGFAFKDTDYLPTQYKEAFDKSFFTAIARYEAIDYCLKKTDKIFSDNSLSYILLKGGVIRSFYPMAWMRTSTDIDILIKFEDLQKVKKLLISKGYEYKETSSYDITFVCDNVVLEVHFKFDNDDSYFDKITLQQLWQNGLIKSKNSSAFVMKDEYLYYYHIEHMAKHIKYGGIGVKSFIDLYYLNNINIDKSARSKLLQDNQLDVFEQTCVGLVSSWFNNAPYLESTALLESYVVSGGAFGTMQSTATAQVVKRGGKFKFFWGRVFLPYNKLCVRYPVLQKHKWLLPFCQLHRLFKAVFCGYAKGIKSEINAGVKVSKEQAEKTKKLFEYLNLK